MYSLLKTLGAIGALTFSVCFNSAAAIMPLDDIDDAIVASAKLKQARLLPRSIFLNKPEISSIRLSPSGEKLVFVTTDQKHSKVWLHDIPSTQNTLLFTSEILNNVHWSMDGQHIIMETDAGIATSSVANAAAPGYVITLNFEEGEIFHGVDPQSPHHFFVSLHNKEDDSFTLYRVDMLGKKTPLYTDKNKLVTFLAEKNGPLKFITRAKGLIHTLVLIENGVEKQILQCRYDDNCGVASFNKKNNIVYMYDRADGNLLGLVALNLNTNERHSIHSDPQGRFDIKKAYFSYETGDPVLVEYNTDYHENYGIGAAMDDHVKTIKAAMDSKILQIRPFAENIWFVIKNNPNAPTSSFHLYNLKTKTLHAPLKDFMATNFIKKDRVTASETAIRTPFWYPADDGFMLQGYVTFPRGVDVSKAPMVVQPHGGPWTRVFGSYSSLAQFLANRGYIVFEPNFRASTGLGRNYVHSANRDFGDGRTQDDIINGTNYLLNRGIGNKDKLAIFGHSFGGFSTMAGLTFTPNMFQVGIAGAPPPSLSKTMQYYVKKQDETRAGAMRVDVMADLAVDINDPNDIARIDAQSPDHHVKKVVKPMYIVAGEKDRKVNILDVRDYAIRLAENGVTVGMLVDKKEGHSFQKPLAKEAYLYLIETVLAKHLGGRHQPLSDLKLDKYIKKNMVMGHLPTLKN